MNSDMLTYKELCAPVSVHFELTEQCQNRCLHCYNHWRGKKTAMESLDRSQLDSILDQFIASRVMSVTITGGEPLLCKTDLFYAISRLTSAGIEVFLNSNLMLLDKHYAERLKQVGLQTILTSLLSWKKKTHTKLTRNPTSFHRTVQGIRQAAASGFSVTINMVVSTLNFEDIYQTALFAHQLGAKSFAATRVALSSSNRSVAPFRLTRKQVQMSLEVLEQVRTDTGIAVDSLACYPSCLLNDLERFRHVVRRRCGAGKTTATIGVHGDVRPCSLSDMTYGNIFTVPLPEIWQRMSDWRQIRDVYQGCQQCRFLILCGGGCRIEAKYSGNIYGPDPYMKFPEAVENAPQNRPVALVPVDQPLYPQKGLKLREEQFGGIVYCKQLGFVPVDHEHFKILRLIAAQEHIVPQNPLTVTKIAEQGRMTKKHLQRFFSLFVAQGLLTTHERG